MFVFKYKLSWAWWFTTVIPALKRPQQENCNEFEVSLGYIVSSKSTGATEYVSVLKAKANNKNTKSWSEFTVVIFKGFLKLNCMLTCKRNPKRKYKKPRTQAQREVEVS